MNRPSILIAVTALFSIGAVAVAGEDDSPRQSNYSTVKLLFIDHQPATGMVLNGGEQWLVVVMHPEEEEPTPAAVPNALK
jgi:hypothetical protein